MKASNSLEMLKFTPCQGSRLHLKAAHETNRQDGDIEPLGNVIVHSFSRYPDKAFSLLAKIDLSRKSSQGDVQMCPPGGRRPG